MHLLGSIRPLCRSNKILLLLRIQRNCIIYNSQAIGDYLDSHSLSLSPKFIIATGVKWEILEDATREGGGRVKDLERLLTPRAPQNSRPPSTV